MNSHEIDLCLERPRDLLEGRLPMEAALPQITKDFLERLFRHAPQGKPWVLRLNAAGSTEEEVEKLRAAIVSHYTLQVSSAIEDLRDYRRNMRQVFLYGGIFLGVCLGLHHMLEGILGERFPRILDEGLIIIGWVAMWRPAEMLTYAWVPLVRRLKLQRHMLQLSVEVASPTEGHAQPGVATPA